MNASQAVLHMCRGTLQLLREGIAPDFTHASRLKWLDDNGYVICCKRGFVLTRKGMA